MITWSRQSLRARQLANQVPHFAGERRAPAETGPALARPVALESARTPWARRLLHFGLLGMLDQDPTGDAWFGAPSWWSSSSGFHCTRLHLGAGDGEVRARDAYRCLLELGAALEALEEVG